MRITLILLIILVFTPVIASAQISTFGNMQIKMNGPKYRQKGHYWDLYGNKLECELIMQTSNSIGGGSSFRAFVNGKKAGELYPSYVKSVIYEKDSIVVITKFSVSSYISYEQDFAKVETNGLINLFEHLGTRQVDVDIIKGERIISYIGVYVINRDETREFIGIYNNKQFEKWFIPMISDNESLQRKILNTKKRNWLKLLPSFVKEYNNINVE